MARIPSPWRRSPAPYPSCLTSSANDRSPMPLPYEIRALLLLGDDLILDLVVGGLRHDLLLGQLVLARVRAAVGDRLRVLVADGGQRLELVRRRTVDVERLLLLRVGLG